MCGGSGVCVCVRVCVSVCACVRGAFIHVWYMYVWCVCVCMVCVCIYLEKRASIPEHFNMRKPTLNLHTTSDIIKNAGLKREQIYMHLKSSLKTSLFSNPHKLISLCVLRAMSLLILRK